jgi:3-oxoacyl-[acyl-carrier protein] reductase
VDLELRGRIAIVNGASQGIGLGIASVLASEGAQVVMTARREPALQEAVQALSIRTGNAGLFPVVGDIRRAEDCERIANEAVRLCGGVHILVNNDGAPPLGASADFDDPAWQKAIDQNFFSVIRMTRAVVPHMRRAGGGSITNIIAGSVLSPRSGYGLSVATWAAVVGFAKTLSIELGPDRITVNNVAPGAIRTSRVQKIAERLGQTEDSLLADIVKDVPVGRIGTVDDIANMVALLSSNRGSYVTGTTIRIDGGMLRNLI